MYKSDPIKNYLILIYARGLSQVISCQREKVCVILHRDLQHICLETNGLLQRDMEHTFIYTLFKKLTTSWHKKNAVRSTDSAHYYLRKGLK